MHIFGFTLLSSASPFCSSDYACVMHMFGLDMDRINYIVIGNCLLEKLYACLRCYRADHVLIFCCIPI
jgi:hypothetical protein